MRVMTWNIHGAIECARWFELERVVNFISAIEPDIVALQEVDSRHLKDGRDVFSVLQESLGNHGIGAKSIIAEDGGYYGQMLISRWPIREVRVRTSPTGSSSRARPYRPVSRRLKGRCEWSRLTLG